MKLTRKSIAFGVLLMLSVGATAGCSALVTATPVAAHNSYPDQGFGVDDRGAIQFQPNATFASVSDYLLPNHINRYTLTAFAGQPTTVNIQAPNQHVLLEIIDPNGYPIVRSQSDASSWSGTLPTDGTYILEAVNTGSSSAYRLNVDVQPVTPPSGVQVYDRGAIQFPPGATMTDVAGFLPFHDIDRYTFAATAGQPASITITSPNRHVLLTLIDPNGYPIVRYQGGIAHWAGILPASGRYRIDAVADGDAATYDLKLVIRQPG